MNKANQLQLANPSARPLKRDPSPQPLTTQPNQPNGAATRPNLQSSPSANTNRVNPPLQARTQAILASMNPNQGRQGAQAEETKLNVDHQPSNRLLQFGDAFEMPPLKNPILESPADHLAAIEKMSMQEVKTLFYNDKLECLLCGADLSTKYRAHILVCAQKNRKVATKSLVVRQANQANAQPILALNRPVSRVPSVSDDGDEMIKKLKGDCEVLAQKMIRMEKDFGQTKKELKQMQETQGLMDRRMMKNESEVDELQTNMNSLIKSMHTNQIVLMQLANANNQKNRERQQAQGKGVMKTK